MSFDSRIGFFSQPERGLLQERVHELLGRNGVRMEHPEVLRLLDEAGAQVDFGTRMVRFPEPFLEEALERSPKKLNLAGAEGTQDADVPRPDGTFHFRTGTGARSYIDPQSGAHRATTISDVADWAKLADALEEISFCAFPSPTDVPVETADIHALSATLQNTRKHVWVQPYSAASIEYLVKLAVTRAQSTESLKRRPLVSLIACSLTPLVFKFMDLEAILQACRHGIPIHACSLPSAGGTAPSTIPGVVLLSAAEILAMVVTAQAIQPGTPVIATPIIFAMDMLTGRSLQSSVEAMQGAAAAVQFMKAAYGIPTHTYGSGADSPEVDGQSMIERSMLGLLVAASGADILGGAGQLEVATMISPVQLVIDDEMAAMLRRIMAGVRVDDEGLAWEDLLAVSPGAHFLTTEHTLRHCRDGLRPRAFVRLARQSWVEQGRRDLLARATEVYWSIKEAERPVELPEEVAQEMEAVVRAADWHLIK